MKFSTETLEIVALNVPAFISHRQKLNLKRNSYTEVLENYIFSVKEWNH